MGFTFGPEMARRVMKGLAGDARFRRGVTMMSRSQPVYTPQYVELFTVVEKQEPFLLPPGPLPVALLSAPMTPLLTEIAGQQKVFLLPAPKRVA